MNQVFTVKQGEWQVLINGVVLPTIWNSRGAALAGIAVELRRISAKALKEQQREENPLR